MTVVRRGVLATCALLLLVVSGWLGAPVARAENDVEFTIDDPEITESSGLAADVNGGFYWTVNDSGDEARAFAVDEDGSTLGSVSFRADVTDVEAVARTGDGLYVADIGDNDAERDTITVYRLIELGLGATSLYSAWDLTYADGQARDAEAIAVTTGGDVLVITKEAEGGVWAAGAPLTAAGTNTLERIGDAPPFVTDATVLADGRIVVRSYLSVSVLDPATFEVQASAPLPLQPQGESITTALDGQSLLVGSEGEGSEVLRVPVPDAVAEDLPEDGAVPPADEPETEPSDDATAGPGEDGQTGQGGGGDDADGSADDETEAGPSGGSRQGTFLAVGIAVALALAAGAVVGLVGRGGSDDDPGSGPAGEDPEPGAPAPDEVGPDEVGPDEVSGAGSEASTTRATAEPAAAAGGMAAKGAAGSAPTDPDLPPVAPAGRPGWRHELTDLPRPTAPETPAAADPVADDRPGDQPTGTAGPAATGSAGDFVLSTERPGRVTWSEPASPTVEPDPEDQLSDVDWLYEEREDR